MTELSILDVNSTQVIHAPSWSRSSQIQKSHEGQWKEEVVEVRSVGGRGGSYIPSEYPPRSQIVVSPLSLAVDSAIADAEEHVDSATVDAEELVVVCRFRYRRSFKTLNSQVRRR